MGTKNRTAIYARYSSEDEIRDGKSRSISNQIEILKEYAIKNEFELVDIYYDYQYSGSTFDRPDVKRLIEDSNNKKFDILLIKDLSRFGRSYIDVGTYINQFITKGIRIISVNDNYDSLLENDFIIFATKNLLNQFYIKDLSKKIRAVNEKKGRLMSLANRHYGYILKDNKFVIYKPEAKIIKRIYELAKAKTSLQVIANQLTKDKIPTPSYSYLIKNKKEEQLNNFNKDKKYDWNPNSIRKILKDDFYIGVATNFKEESKCSLDKNYKIIDDHKAIITKEEYDSLDRTYFTNLNQDLKKENLWKMIYCKKCLSRTNLQTAKSTITAMEKDGNKIYYDHQCERAYPLDILNMRIYDVMRNRYKEIKNNAENYICNIVKEKYDDVSDLREIAANKKKYEDKAKKLFESFMNAEITKEVYIKKAEELSKLVEECDIKLKSANLNEYKADEVRQKVNKFLNYYYENDDNLLEPMKEFISKAIYNPENGEIDIVFKFEEELDIPSKRLSSLVKVREKTLKDFNLDEIVYEIIKENPHIKCPDITKRAQKIFHKFTLSNVQRSLRSLRLQKKIKFDGKASLTDGYVVLEYKDNLNYNGLTLNQREKDIFRMLWNNPKLKYEDIVDATGLSLDWVRRIVKKIRRAGGFADKRFDKTYIPDGYMHSIYVEDPRITSGFVQNIYKDIDENPNISVDDIVAKYNISLDKATIYIERRRNMTNAN